MEETGRQAAGRSHRMDDHPVLRRQEAEPDVQEDAVHAPEQLVAVEVHALLRREAGQPGRQTAAERLHVGTAPGLHINACRGPRVFAVRMSFDTRTPTGLDALIQEPGGTCSMPRYSNRMAQRSYPWLRLQLLKAPTCGQGPVRAAVHSLAVRAPRNAP